MAEETHVEAATNAQSKKKRVKCLLYILLFAVFQTGVILLFALTVMRVTTPKFRIRSANFGNFDYSATSTSPSFNIMMNAELGVKNTNFGHYKFEDSTIYFYYINIQVGETFVPSARARARSTKKFNIMANLSSAVVQDLSLLGYDLNSGVLTLRSQSRLRGKVEIVKVLKKKKSTGMDCTLAINLALRSIGDLRCD